MPFIAPKPMKSPKIQRKTASNWMKGVVSELDDGRVPIDALRDASNMLITQDGTLRPRPSLVPYGPAPLGKILGETKEFTRFEGGKKTFYLVNVQVVSGTAKAYVAKGESSSWAECTGATFNYTADAHFVQIDNKLVVLNGKDALSYIDTDTFAITRYTSISNPSAPTVDTNSITGTAYKVYYAVTANSTVGETTGSVLTVNVGKDRDLWNQTTESVKIKWTTVANVKSWNVYAGIAADGAGQPKLYWIAGGIEPATLTFTDNGSRQQDISRPLPTDNNTAGPKARRGDVFDGRLFLVGDTNDPYRVWRGGDYKHELDFSPSNGGGYTPIGSGTADVPISVRGFRTGKGDPMVMVLTQSSNGRGKRFYMSPMNVTYGSQSFTVWKAEEDSGQDGTDSPDGAIIYNDNVYYPSRDGFKTTGTKPQLQNILSTDKITNTIQDRISTLNTDAMDKAVGVAYEGRLYWALPVNSTSNNKIWICDLQRNGSWMFWDMKADWMTLYNDNSGKTHMLVIRGNSIYELSYAKKTNEINKHFLTRGTMGQTYISEDGEEWANLIDVKFRVMRPQGGVTFGVTVMTEDGLMEFKEYRRFGGKSTRVGWSEPKVQWSDPRGWSMVKGTPKTFNTAVEEVVIEVDEDVQWYQPSFYSGESGVDYTLARITSKYVSVGLKDLT